VAFVHGAHAMIAQPMIQPVLTGVPVWYFPAEARNVNMMSLIENTNNPAPSTTSERIGARPVSTAVAAISARIRKSASG
jgi:hypothetical protein